MVKFSTHVSLVRSPWPSVTYFVTVEVGSWNNWATGRYSLSGLTSRLALSADTYFSISGSDSWTGWDVGKYFISGATSCTNRNSGAHYATGSGSWT